VISGQEKIRAMENADAFPIALFYSVVLDALRHPARKTRRRVLKYVT